MIHVRRDGRQLVVDGEVSVWPKDGRLNRTILGKVTRKNIPKDLKEMTHWIPAPDYNDLLLECISLETACNDYGSSYHGAREEFQEKVGGMRTRQYRLEDEVDSLKGELKKRSTTLNADIQRALNHSEKMVGILRQRNQGEKRRWKEAEREVGKLKDVVKKQAQELEEWRR